MKTAKTKIREVFAAACELESAEAMNQYLNEACGGDVQLRREVEELLRAHREAGKFLGGTAPANVIGANENPRELCGTTVGPYKLLETIGEGGMGTVYMAQQSDPVKRRVAVKLIKAGMDSKQVIARFEAERQALAVMDHPNIAKVFDAGASESGRPYFVMELVKGKPITQFCDEQKLDIENRLKLFQQICHAVQHAHQKGIIHRDIKPSNVLIAMYDDRPVPKVIDFGVAKATGEELTEKTMFTRFGQIVGTLEYMSPEQAQFNQLDIDTRSDVYSLGAVLYELLSGEPPFERERLKNQALDETLRMIREEEPTKPSTKLHSSASAAQAATNRTTTTDKLNSIVRSDLDWIVMKAIDKDRTRRYATADELALEIDRYLNNEPVNAGPPSATYRFRKFARRNKTTLAFGATVAAALLLGMVGTTWQAIRASAALSEKTIALEQTQKESEKNSILANLVLGEIIRSARPITGNPDATVREAIFSVEKKMNAQRIPDRQMEGWLCHNIAGYFFKLGEYAAAKRNYLRAYEVRSEIFGSDGEPTLTTAKELSDLYSRLGEHDQAIEMARQLFEACLRLYGNEGEQTVDAKGKLGVRLLRAGKYKEAEEILTRTIEDARRLDLEKKEAWAVNELGTIYYGTERYDEAMECWSTALKILARINGDDHVSTLGPSQNLANVLKKSGRFVEAEKALSELLPKYETNYGHDNPETIRVLRNLAEIQLSLRDFAMAAKNYRRVLAAQRKRFGKESGRVLATMHNLAMALEYVDAQEALELSTEVVEIAKLKWGERDPSTLFYVNGLGIKSQKLREFKTATECFRDIIEARLTLGVEMPNDRNNARMLGGAYCNLATVLVLQQQYPEAVASYSDAIDVLEELSKTDSTLVTKEFLSNSYEGRAWAARYAGQFEQSLEDMKKAIDVTTDDRRKAYLELIKAQTLAAQGDHVDACRSAENAFNRFPDDSEIAYELASLYSIASSSAANSPDDSSDDSSDDQVAEYVNQCFERLDTAKSLGYFDVTSSVIGFEAKPDFAAIRNDPRYERFLESLSTADKK